MSKKIIPESDGTERIPDQGELITVGQWYWVKGEKGEWLACVTYIGSNFAEMTHPDGGHARVHLDEFVKECRPEPHPEAIIREKTEHYRGVVRSKLIEVKNLTARLGIVDPLKAGSPQDTSTRALSTLSGTDNVKTYKKDLVKAKEKELPKLFEEIRKASEGLATWMKAQALPLKAAAEGMEEIVEQIEDRIFNVSLYAGLTEKVKQVSEGKPADVSEKLRIMQRLAYMDEECLLNYRIGGMEFGDIREFDKWLACPDNMNRIIPFPRTIIAFRVRRNRKERDWGGSIGQALINFQLGELDKTTFLYIKNGERLYRMNCDLDFGELIFPGIHEFNLSQPMMAKMFCSRVQEVITKSDYDELIKEDEERKLKAKEWEKVNPKEDYWKNPHSHGSFYSLGEYQPFNKSSVYFDEIKDEIDKRIKHYNRIALIVQGLFDRSEILHPHPPVKLWSPDGFAAAVELVYDGSNTLHYGEAPDFERYRRVCSQSLGMGSVTIGQDRFWEAVEARRENAHRRGNWRYKSDECELEHFRPYGNPGPGYLAKIVHWNVNGRKATFRWTRKRQRSTWNAGYGDPIAATVTVPDSHLFNADAYKPGDYKQFFVDPRTRAQYLKWAPMLLAAEEYHAGNFKVGPKHEK